MFSKTSSQTPAGKSSPSNMALSAKLPKIARMPRSVSSRATWPTSTFTSTQRKPPAPEGALAPSGAPPPFKRSRRAISADVLPVCRGACSTK